MREILFRGKIEQSIYEPIAENGWVYGNYIECLDDHWRNIDENGNDISETRPMIFTIIESNGMKQHIRIPVIPKTLGQYTGIDDVNGNKIFEGDIVAFKGDPPDEPCYIKEVKNLVVFEQSSFKLRKTYEVGKTNYINDYLDGWENPICLGNIHDNPELLKEVKECS